MKVRNYMFVPNPWSLQPQTRNKLQLPAAKAGKDSRQLYDKNHGYNRPNQINSDLWITADINVKEAINNFQMELEGKHLQIRWKPAQKKNTKNQIVIYGISPGFDPKGIMRELLYVLKESKKELCNGQRYSINQNMSRQDMPLPLFNGYYMQSTPRKALIHSKGLKKSLNKNKEFTQDGCHLFHLEYHPAKNPRMEMVWSHFIESGRGEVVLGRCSKIFILPNLGRQALTTITLIRRYMHFHICYTGVSRIHSHTTAMDLDKWVKISMVDPETLPQKFTTLRHEYTDLCTPEGLEVFHAVIPHVETAACGPSEDCLYLKNNHKAKDLSSKIQVCLSVWWWNLFNLRGYTERTARSLLNCFEYEASQLANQSMFDERMGHYHAICKFR
jgi:hypothetical protein